MITQFKGARAWNAYMAYVGFVFHLYKARTMRLKNFTTTEECNEYFREVDNDTRRKILIELMSVQRIDHYDMMALLAVHQNKHGIAIDTSTIDNYGLSELAEMVLETLLRCAQEKDAGLFF